MSHVYIIWDNGQLSAWRKNKKSIVLLEDTFVEKTEDLLAFLTKNVRKLRISSLTLLMDHASLDHHVERLPLLSTKLQSQMMVQRKEKRYGQAQRTWVAQLMTLSIQNSHSFYLVASLPVEISEPISTWALKFGVIMHGIYSLPHSLGISESKLDGPKQSRIIYRALDNSGYLLAYDSLGNFLFANRIPGTKNDATLLESGLKRLTLFTEQEFGVTPTYTSDLDTKAKTSNIEVLKRLINAKKQAKLNLITTKHKSLQLWRIRRHRGFAASILMLGISIFFMLPQAERKRDVLLRAESIENTIRSESIEKRKIENDIVKSRALLHLIKFSRQRTGLGPDDPVPMPLAIVLGTVSHSMPEVVELDFIDCSLNIKEPSVQIQLGGRPLSPDVDLVEILELFKSNIELKSWSFNEWNLAFSRKNIKESRFERRGSLRSFNLSFKLYPFTDK